MRMDDAENFVSLSASYSSESSSEEGAEVIDQNSNATDQQIEQESNKTDVVPRISHQDIFMSPVAELPSGDGKVNFDDSVIKRVNMSSIRNMPFEPNQSSTRTTPRRPPKDFYLCASNTIVATNGLVYHFEPFQLPPPAEIAELFNELNDRRGVKSYANHQNGGKNDGRKEGFPPSSAKELKSVLRYRKLETRDRELPQEWMDRKDLTINTRKPRADSADIVSTNKYTLTKENSKQVVVRSPKMEEDIAKHDHETDKEETDLDEYFEFRNFNIWRYIMGQIFGSPEPGHEETVADANIKKFLSVPFVLEGLLFFGFFLCLDAFMYTLTFLPIRVITSLVLLSCKLLSYISNGVINLRVPGTSGFHRSNTYDLMRGVFLVMGSLTLCYIDMSRIYHLIKRQTLIKLYVMTGMLEIFDKLLGSLGQDAFSSLNLQIKLLRPQEYLSIFLTFTVVLLYVVLHSILYFVHAATLMVALDSSNQAILPLIILNNFAEIKSFVFKKFDKQNLFQLTCADITERFNATLFVTLITVVSVMVADSHWMEVLPKSSHMVGLMVLGEMIADWVKHCFITKFNSIEARAYEDYAKILRDDILACHIGKGTHLDPTYTLTRRVGLAQVRMYGPRCVLI